MTKVQKSGLGKGLEGILKDSRVFSFSKKINKTGNEIKETFTPPEKFEIQENANPLNRKLLDTINKSIEKEKISQEKKRLKKEESKELNKDTTLKFGEKEITLEYVEDYTLEHFKKTFLLTSSLDGEFHDIEEKKIKEIMKGENMKKYYNVGEKDIEDTIKYIKDNKESHLEKNKYILRVPKNREKRDNWIRYVVSIIFADRQLHGNEKDFLKELGAKIDEASIVKLFLEHLGYIEELVSKLNTANEELRATNEEVERQRDFILKQKEALDDSILYASTIQNALLPSNKEFNEMFPNNYILYRPRDVVSGDFYWIHIDPEGDRYICVGDCTGHGVPGAFMSMLMINILNNIVGEKGGIKKEDRDYLEALSLELKNTGIDKNKEHAKKLDKIINELNSNENLRPDKILNIIRETIIKSLKDRPDGMDAILIKIHQEPRTDGNIIVDYAGANNDLYIEMDNAQFEKFKQSLSNTESNLHGHTLISKNEIDERKETRKKEEKKKEKESESERNNDVNYSKEMRQKLENGETMIEKIMKDDEIEYNETGDNNYLVTIKADKQPVGLVKNLKLFTNKKMLLPEGCTLHLKSDGVESQFGRDKGRRYTSTRLKDLILNNKNGAITNQGKKIEHEFDKRKGEYEQVDDITLFGIKLERLPDDHIISHDKF